MERPGYNLGDRLGHIARELERRAAGDILICASICKGMHLQPASVPVIRPASVFSEDRGSRKTRGSWKGSLIAETSAKANSPFYYNIQICEWNNCSSHFFCHPANKQTNGTEDETSSAELIKQDTGNNYTT